MRWVLLAVLLAAGCLDPVVSDRPENWQQGVALTAYSGSKLHNANEGYSLRPPAGTAAPAPDHCIAYQSGEERKLDTCGVHGTDEGRGGVIGPWTLKASWDGDGERLHENVELHPERRTVVAFDAGGVVVAFWDGLARDADGQWVTE